MEFSNCAGNNASDDVRMFFMGSPLMDVTADVDDEFLRKYKMDADNAYSVDEDSRAIFEEIRARSSVQIGGSVTNTARTVQKLMNSPKRVTYLGTVGNDEYGKLIRDELKKEGLAEALTEIEGSTGKVAVLLRGNTRTLVTDLGVSRFFSLNEEMRNRMDSPCLIYFSGFFINVSMETITAIIAKNKTIAFNLGAPFLCTRFPDEMIDIYRNSSMIFGNESEHRALANILNITSNDLGDVIASTNRVLSDRSRVVVATRGAGPVLLVHDGDWCEFEVKSLDEDKIVDTNGAGDTFVGGFLARYVNGDSVANCVKCGIGIARRVVQNRGFSLDFSD